MKAVTGAELCRALRRDRWHLLRSRGSHQTWGKSGSSNITVPVHAGKTLSRGLFAALLKQSALTASDL